MNYYWFLILSDYLIIPIQYPYYFEFLIIDYQQIFEFIYHCGVGIIKCGFEEEFERSSKRLKETGQPEMAIYFKKIPEDYMDDPGRI